MDTGIALIVAASLVCQVVVLAYRREAIVRPGYFRTANICTAVAVFLTVFGVAFMVSVVKDRAFVMAGTILFAAGMFAAGLSLLFLLLSLRLVTRGVKPAPPVTRQASARQAGSTADARSASFRQLYFQKKREVGRLRERVDELEEQVRMDLGPDPDGDDPDGEPGEDPEPEGAEEGAAPPGAG